MEALQGIVLLIVWLVIIPCFAGVVPAHLVEKKYKKLSTIYICGWLVLMGIFEIMGTVCTLTGKTLTELISGYSAVIGIEALCGAYILVSGFVKFSRQEFLVLPNISGEDKEEKWTWVLFAVLFVLQIVLAFFVATPSGDDAYYVSVALSADVEDKLFTVNPYTGEDCERVMHLCLSQFPIFIGFLARISGCHAAIIAHCILPPVLILLSYMTFYKLAAELFKENRRNISLFMVIISLLQLFGASSEYTSEVMLLTRTWQGKSIFANIAFPAVVYLMLRVAHVYTQNRDNKMVKLAGYYTLIAGVNLVGIFGSTLGTILLIVYEYIVLLVIAIRNKRLRVMLGVVSSLPCYIYIMLYLYGG